MKTTKFLGITLTKLQLGPHFDELTNRLSTTPYAAYKIDQLIDAEIVRLVYFSYFPCVCHSVFCCGEMLLTFKVSLYYRREKFVQFIILVKGNH